MRKPKLHTVYSRLFADDVEEIRAVATAKGNPFQTELRLLVHEGVQRRRELARGKVVR